MLETIGALTAATLRAADGFGSRMAISEDGTTLAIGTPFDDASNSGINTRPVLDPANPTNDAGAVYIYTRADTDWIPQAYIKVDYYR